ncbi:MAG TPA: glycoside hydrolase, partial [Chloroflexi bacterium]|nr:glycoside hydrolase [Chloroflexota bacterium]
AWEYLSRTRETLISWQRDYAPADVETMGRAWQEIYAAEGSDWFWWYCSRNESPEEAILNETFRGHLANVFTLMGVPLPDWLKEPIQ